MLHLCFLSVICANVQNSVGVPLSYKHIKKHNSVLLLLAFQQIFSFINSRVQKMYSVLCNLLKLNFVEMLFVLVYSFLVLYFLFK